RRRLGGREADHLARLRLVAALKEESDLLEPGLVPRRAAGRARLDDLAPARERARSIAERRGGPGGSAERLRRRRVLCEHLVVQPAGIRGVARAALEVSERDPVRRGAGFTREPGVDLPGERQRRLPARLVAGIELVLERPSDVAECALAVDAGRGEIE